MEREMEEIIYIQNAPACLQPKYSFILRGEKSAGTVKGTFTYCTSKDIHFSKSSLRQTTCQKMRVQMQASKYNYWIFSILLREYLEGEADCGSRGDNEGISNQKSECRWTQKECDQVDNEKFIQPQEHY